MIRNEEGLVNYLIEKEIDNIIDELEEISEQNTIDVDGKLEHILLDEEEARDLKYAIESALRHIGEGRR